MPLQHHGLVNHGGNVDRELEEKIEGAFKVINQNISAIAQQYNLFPQQVRMLQPLHFIVLVGKKDVFVVMSVSDVGAMVINQYQDRTAKPISLVTAIFLAERDLSFRDAFGFQFPRSILDLDGQARDSAFAQVAQQCIDEENSRLERLSRTVKINPIFDGREFVLQEHLVFGDPFDTIFRDHIKPAVESMKGFICLRADDIFDNRPIIEDIWKYTNEARLLISDLTGRNPNVFYETGVAHTVGKEVILITQSMNDVPFRP